MSILVQTSHLVQSRIENLSKFCHASTSRGIILVRLQIPRLLLRLSELLVSELLVLGSHRLLFSKWYRR